MLSRLKTCHRYLFPGFFVLIAVISSVAQAGTPADTLITNRAAAVYPWEGSARTTWSNWVTVVVQQVGGIAIYPSSTGTPDSDDFAPARRQSVTPGQQVTIPYRLTNTGNGVDTFGLTVETWVGLAAEDFVIYHDRNDNGVVDLADPIIDRITLPSQECATVLVTFRIPGQSRAGDIYYTALRAVSDVDSLVVADETWNATTVYVETPNLFVRRSYSVDLSPPQGCPHAARRLRALSAMSANTSPLSSVITHTIIIDNTGCCPARDVRILEPLHPNENPLTDAYGPGMPLLINGTPVSLESGEPLKARIITDSEGKRFVEILIVSVEPTQSESVIIEFKASIDWNPQEQRLSKATEVSYERQQGERVTIMSNQIMLSRDLTHGTQLIPITPQVRNVAYAGERVEFRLNVVNIGEIPCVPEVILDGPIPHGWQVSLSGADGVTPLHDNNNNGTPDLGLMNPGAERIFVLSVVIPTDQSQIADAPYSFTVTFFRADPPECSMTTTFHIEQVEGVEQLWDPVRLEVDAGEAVIPGTLLTYNLSFGNASELEARDVVVTARLSPHLAPPIAFDGQVGSEGVHGLNSMSPTEAPVVYDPDRHAIIWSIPSVPAGNRGNLVFSTYVMESVPRGTTIEVEGELACALTKLVALSNCVATCVITEELAVSLSADEALVAIGEENTYYVDVTNLNASIDLHDVEVQVLLPSGLTYRRLTSRQDDEPISDPRQASGMLVYRLEELPAASTVRLAFKTIVNAAADSELTVRAVAAYRPRADECLESTVARVTTYVSFGVLSDQGIIVGRLRTGEGIPVPGVRVVLDNGRYALSDQDGRFSFTGVRPGPRLLRLDPATLRSVASIPGGIDLQDVTKVRTIVPTAGIAMIDLDLTPLAVHVVTEDIVMSERADK
jgi:uncharacterized repeat protein (TIGR01451 family)